MAIHRRTVLGLGVAAAAATLTGCEKQGTWVQPDPAGDSATPAAGPTTGPAAAARDGVSTAGATGADAAGAADAGIVDAATEAARAAYNPGLTAKLASYLKPTSDNPDHPSYAGAVALALLHGRTVVHTAVGEALRYKAGPVLLPAAERVAMRNDSIFDLASITKVYTAILALQQVDQGRIDLAAPVVQYLPDFTGARKSAVTVAMLLAHTSGLPVGAKVTGYATLAERWAAVLATPLVSGAVPGTVFRYSSVGLMVLGKIIEKVTGLRLDAALNEYLCQPLGLRDTGFTPNTWLSAADQRDRLAATDARSSRGLLRGVVHDDVANHLNGIAGHAGIFSSAREVGIIGQLLLNGGRHGERQILAEATVRQMLRNANAGLPAVDPDRPNRTSAHGLGVVLDQPWFMGKMSSPTSFGHTGFTGTSLLVQPSRRMVFVLLTNRAHPNWSWADPDPIRVATANILAKGAAGS